MLSKQEFTCKRRKNDIAYSKKKHQTNSFEIVFAINDVPVANKDVAATAVWSLGNVGTLVII
jgi:hypothetical protein